MVFSSITFLIYFLPAFLFIYFILPKSWKNVFILLSSIIFYSWGGPKFIFVILGTTFLDFFIVRKMYYSQKPQQRRFLLILSLCMNLGLLFYFKYFDFFTGNLNVLLNGLGSATIQVAKIALPIGISFYTFESLTYVIDVYRRVHKPLDNFWEYQLYIILFPKLIAGPIIRYQDISDQIKDHVNQETFENRLSGFIRFCIGLGKKVLIANVMGEQADLAFDRDPHTLDTLSAWFGIIAYTFQIYFDFSGYSDMAIGLGRMMGFRFPENFNNPYTSSGITDFWRRWHITLGAWMRNYLYIPLGGNRVNTKARLYFNLWLVFLCSGLWHGAAWTFVFWGAYHGFFLVVERSFLLKYLEKIPRPLAAIYSFFVVMMGWVFFRSDSLSDALTYLHQLFAFDFSQIIAPANGDFRIVVWIAVCFSFCTFIPPVINLHNTVFYKNLPVRSYLPSMIAALILLVICVASVTGSAFNPFIYFRF
jgi:alginate O-acetyltransferase complex protein AlgI